MSIDYLEISNIVSDTIAKGSKPLTDSQRIVMAGAIAVVFEKELAATKQKLEAAEQTIRESQEQGSVVWTQSTHLDKFIHKACGADSMFAKCSGRKLMSDYIPLYTKPVIIPQSAEQLHIKELREALEIADGFMPNRGMDSICNACVDLVEKALAKQPDTRALDKLLLEAEVEMLEGTIGCTDFERGIILHDRKSKLAELNKE